MSSQPTITSLLNSLHTHLQTQTQLLPTLHAQLGLPPTALADELSSLQEALTRCVEDQIGSRRKQVLELEERCENLESECHSYSIALGNSTKGLEITASELRREPVLPRRFDRLAELQEKLRQLYHTKLEQLNALTARLVSISRIVGDRFFHEDVLGHSTGSSPDMPYQNVSPERFSRLEKELVRGKGEMSKRLNQLSAIFIQIDWLHTELGIVPLTLENLPSSSSSSSNFLGVLPVSRPSSAIGYSMASPSDPLTPTPTSGSRSKPSSLVSPSNPVETEIAYQRIFAHFVARLDEADDGPLARRCAGLEGVQPTPGLLAWAETTRNALEDLQRRREAHIQAMYDQLEGLWRRLGVPDAAMDEFVDAHRGSTEETIHEYEAELERMLELKRERMSAFVENARGEIARLWDELLIGEEGRSDFPPYFDDEHTEELLLLHEDEIRRLKEERRTKSYLLPSVRKYFDICEEEKELENAASDQSRLLGRGPRDPGRLLREEKMRKRVQKEKPRLEKDLLTSIPAWEAEAGRPFLVHGESMLQILFSAAGLADKENGRGMKARAGSVPPRATTPNSAPGKGMITPAIRPASSMGRSQSAPNKRPRLAETNVPQVPGFVPHSVSGAGAGAGHPPSKIAIPVPVRASILPIPVPRVLSATIPRQHAALGIGRPPSREPLTSSISNTLLSGSQRARSAGSGLGVSSSRNSQTIASKAKRARRESFRPRPSGHWVPVPQGRYGGMDDDALREENED
ncbi:microtubule associated protein-domain-containing protein [Multifurca ochricompacta]|uniref:Microtubule associated protein-domain-containing protein n=1 Tax=Multifurca ochricompacta TaxID=376703 RepID=A0AAD4QM14_9AGAM|nr:microtubule associated protein-domain-containing protein [Multifurca ochricompacta]